MRGYVVANVGVKRLSWEVAYDKVPFKAVDAWYVKPSQSSRNPGFQILQADDLENSLPLAAGTKTETLAASFAIGVSATAVKQCLYRDQIS